MTSLRLPVLAAVAALTAAPALAAPAADLSGFLGGFETQCSGPEPFLTYRDSLGERYTSSGSRRNKVAVPAAYRSAIGRETVSDKGEYVAVSVPLAGTYKGLPVARLDFELGNENGIYTVALVFAAPVDKVRATLGLGTAGARKARSGQDPSIALRADRAGTKIFCNFSD